MRKAKLVIGALIITLTMAAATAQAGDMGQGAPHAGAGITNPPRTAAFSGSLEPPGFAG